MGFSESTSAVEGSEMWEDPVQVLIMSPVSTGLFAQKKDATGSRDDPVQVLVMSPVSTGLFAQKKDATGSRDDTCGMGKIPLLLRSTNFIAVYMRRLMQTSGGNDMLDLLLIFSLKFIVMKEWSHGIQRKVPQVMYRREPSSCGNTLPLVTCLAACGSMRFTSSRQETS